MEQTLEFPKYLQAFLNIAGRGDPAVDPTIRVRTRSYGVPQVEFKNANRKQLAIKIISLDKLINHRVNHREALKNDTEFAFDDPENMHYLADEDNSDLERVSERGRMFGDYLQETIVRAPAIDIIDTKSKQMTWEELNDLVRSLLKRAYDEAENSKPISGLGRDHATATHRFGHARVNFEGKGKVVEGFVYKPSSLTTHEWVCAQFAAQSSKLYHRYSGPKPQAPGSWPLIAS